MKWWVGVLRMVAAMGVVVAVAVVWHGGDEASEPVSKSGCGYYSGNCTYIVPVPAGRFHTVP